METVYRSGAAPDGKPIILMRSRQRVNPCTIFARKRPVFFLNKRFSNCNIHLFEVLFRRKVILGKPFLYRPKKRCRALLCRKEPVLDSGSPIVRVDGNGEPLCGCSARRGLLRGSAHAACLKFGRSTLGDPCFSTTMLPRCVRQLREAVGQVCARTVGRQKSRKKERFETNTLRQPSLLRPSTC